MDIVRSLFHYESKALLYSSYSVRVTKFSPPKYKVLSDSTGGTERGKYNQAGGNELAVYLGKL